MREIPRYSGRIDPAREAEFTAFLGELTRASAPVILSHYLSGTAIDTKSDDSPVTAADRGAEEAMRALIEARYPDHGILGEEFGLLRGDAEYRWVLDPIDGTQAFIANCYIFGTLIALTHRGRPVLGAIHSPLTGHLLAGNGERTWLGERTMRVRECSRVEDAVMLTTDYRDAAGHSRGAGFQALAGRVRLLRGWGDCHGYFQVATGGADIMIDPEMKDWDILPMVPIIEGAGGRVSDWQGGDPVGAECLVATGGAIHDEVVAILNH